MPADCAVSQIRISAFRRSANIRFMTYADVFTRLSGETPPEHLKPAGAPFAIATALTLLTRIVGVPLFALDCPPPKLAQMFPGDRVPEAAVPVFGRELTRYQAWRRLLLDCQLLETGCAVDPDPIAGLQRLARIYISRNAQNPFYYLRTVLPEGISPCQLDRELAIALDRELSGSCRQAYRASLSVMDRLQDHPIAKSTGLLPEERIGSIPKERDHVAFAPLPEPLKSEYDALPRIDQNAIAFVYRIARMEGLFSADQAIGVSELGAPDVVSLLQVVDPANHGFTRPSRAMYLRYVKQVEFRKNGGVKKCYLPPEDPVERDWKRLFNEVREKVMSPVPAHLSYVAKSAKLDGLRPCDLTRQWCRETERSLPVKRASGFRSGCYRLDDLHGTGVSQDLLPPEGTGIHRPTANTNQWTQNGSNPASATPWSLAIAAASSARS